MAGYDRAAGRIINRKLNFDGIESKSKQKDVKVLTNMLPLWSLYSTLTFSLFCCVLRLNALQLSKTVMVGIAVSETCFDCAAVRVPLFSLLFFSFSFPCSAAVPCDC